MIPYAILSGKLIWQDASVTEIRILDLSAEGFTFRLPQKYTEICNVRDVQLAFYSFERADYEHITLKHFIICQEHCASPDYAHYSANMDAAESAYNVYRFCTEEPGFTKNAQHLMKEYMNYISLKMSGDNAALSEALVAYDSAGESIFPVSADAWKKELSEKTRKLCHKKPQNIPWTYPALDPELAIPLDSRQTLEYFLQMSWSEFTCWFWKNRYLSWHPISQQMIRCIYIGSQYCLHRFPDDHTLILLLDKTSSLGLRPVITFPPMKQSESDRIRKILEVLKQWSLVHHDTIPGGKLELVINDWGMARMIQKTLPDHFTLTLGILLNKRRKDVRLPYKKGQKKQLEFLQENSENVDFFQKYLLDHYDITSYSYESCGYPFTLAPGSHILHLPFYQMNTAGHCTLYAACKYGDRGKQTAVAACPGYCEAYAFLYPSMLSMIGIGNTLFGYDEHILMDGNYFHEICGATIHRIVVS